MVVRSHVQRILIVVALVCLPRATCAADTWREVKSEHFTVITDASERKARNIAWQFEQVRAAIAKAWPWARVQLDVPIFVVAVKDEASMKKMAPEYWEVRGGTRPAAVFTSGPDGHYVALRADIESEEQGVNPYNTAFWSYSALVLDASFPRGLPLWLKNGLASVLSNTIIKEKEVQFGKPLPWVAQEAATGTRVSLAELLAVTQASPYYRRSETRSQFDAQSWALVQFLLFGLPDRDARLNQMVKLLLTGVPSAEAMVRVYGSLEAVDTAATLYVHQGVYKYMRLLVESDTSVAKVPVRVLTATESAIDRGAFHVAMGRGVEARALVAEIRASDPAASAADDLEALLLDREQKRDEALVLFTKAAAAGSTSFWTYYRVATAKRVSFADRDAVRTTAGYLERATVLNPDFGPAFSYLATLQLELGDHAHALMTAQRAVTLRPGDVSSRLVAARALVQMGRKDEAAAVATEALQFARDDQERTVVQALLSAISGRGGTLRDDDRNH
jgi:tetratricopeptide (TPR) repeat protein